MRKELSLMLSALVVGSSFSGLSTHLRVITGSEPLLPRPSPGTSTRKNALMVTGSVTNVRLQRNDRRYDSSSRSLYHKPHPETADMRTSDDRSHYRADHAQDRTAPQARRAGTHLSSTTGRTTFVEKKVVVAVCGADRCVGFPSMLVTKTVPGWPSDEHSRAGGGVGLCPYGFVRRHLRA